MSKSRPFSIYLLKAGFNAANSLKADHDLEAADAGHLPEGASLYILDAHPKPPWWKEYFGVQEELWQEHKGALVFLPVGERCFALSFGQVFHHLNDAAYEYDFGLRTTLNCLDPNELKSADMVAPGPARRKRTQVPVSTELTFLDFDGNSEIIKSLTGKVKPEHADLFKNATGSIALKISLKLEPAQLKETCETLLELYNRDDFKTTFPNIQNIVPVKDPAKIQELDRRLLILVADRNEQVTLTIPDIIDYRDNTCCTFSGDGKASEIYPDISLEHFYEFLGEGFDLNSLTIDLLHSYRMNLTDVEGNISQAYPIYRTLLCEIASPDENVVYHLCEGNWYKAEGAFLTKLTTYLDGKCADTNLSPYNHDGVKDGKAVYSEENYNNAIPTWDARYVCLDQTNISPNGHTNIEPCDIYTAATDATARSGYRATFYHLKISTRSSQLSHLFNQGVNAIELIQLEESSRAKMKELVAARLGDNEKGTYITPIDAFDFKLVFGIITHKDATAKSNNLPLFSKISLMRTMQRLDLMKVPSVLTFIKDDSPKKAGHAKHIQIIAEVVSLDDGKAIVRTIDGQGADSGKSIKGCPREVRHAAVGTRYKIAVKRSDDGELSTYHSWPYSLAA